MQSEMRWFAKRGSALRGGLASPGGLERIRANHRSWDLYWALNKDSAPRYATKARGEEITEWCNILVDLDPVSDDAIPILAARVFHERIERVLGSVQPHVIDTGRGVQLILELQPYRLSGHVERTRVAAAVRAFFRGLLSAPGPVHGCTLDTSCSDLARVARLPGSVNQKTGRECAVLESGARLTHAQMSTLLALEGDSPEPPRVVPGPWKRNLHLLPEDVLRFLAEGAKEPGRHHLAYKTAAYLRDLHLGETTAVAMVRSAGLRSRPPLPSAEVDRCVRKDRKSVV